jgi:hypothetical protein
MNVDLEAIRTRARERRTATSTDERRGEAESDLEALLGALAEAQADVTRLAQEDDELRESAEIWIRLYEGNVRRANRAEAEVMRLRRSLPRYVQDLYERLDRVTLLTDVINDVVRDCEVCAQRANSSVSTGAVDACARCQRALDALRSTANLAGSQL